MSEALRRLTRLWAAIFVAYALVLQSLAPAFATGPSHEPFSLLCSEAADADGGQPADGRASHGDLCCILCAAGLPAGILPEAGTPGVPVVHGPAEAPRPNPTRFAAGPSPETGPVVPRGPPTAV